jgi:hypothetical protein
MEAMMLVEAINNEQCVGEFAQVSKKKSVENIPCHMKVYCWYIPMPCGWKIYDIE